jgi:hypothetical protein
MTKVQTMPIELFLIASALLFLAKTAIYTGAACFVVHYATKQLIK